MTSFTDKIDELGRSDPIVRSGLHGWKRNEYTYLEALEMLVVELSAIRIQQQETLVQIATRAPGPGVLR